MSDYPETPSVPPQLPADYVLVHQWIEVATRGLCDEARERIAAEVRRHVYETVAELEGEDVPSSEAFRVALQQLGDAKIARRSFRQTNWTETEHRLLSKYCSSCAPLGKKLTGLCLLSVVIAECAVFFLGANGLKWDDFLQTQYIALNVLSILFAFHFRERCDPRASMGALLIVALAPLLAVPSWWHEYQEDSFNRVRSIVWIVIALCFALFGLFRLVPLWLKIGRVSPPAKLEK